MKEATLIILAAGLGSRYGGLKQFDTFLPKQRTIMEYSLYDAYQAGFRHFVFVVKEENKTLVQNIVDRNEYPGSRFDYVNQQPYKDRKKPLGTAHALLCCEGKVKSRIGIINGDDFYGKEAFEKIYEALMCHVEDQQAIMIGYRLENTLSKYGGVSRGVCQHNDYHLSHIEECTGIQRVGDHIEDDQSRVFPFDAVISMNMWGFADSVFEDLPDYFDRFLKEEYSKNPEKAEFYLPTFFDQLMKDEKLAIDIIPTTSIWYGITYQEDKESVYEGLIALESRYESPLVSYDFVSGIAKSFQIQGEILSASPIASGNINDTYVIKTCKQRYLLQRINHTIFKDVDGLMANIHKIIDYLHGLNQTTLTLVATLEGKDYTCNDGCYYRMYKYIEDSFTYDNSVSKEAFYLTGRSFGQFFKTLSHFDPQQLNETIPNFHHTPKRYQQFEESLLKASSKRLEKAHDVIEELKKRENLSHVLYDLYENNEIPLRVCHNDTKLSNILMNKHTKEPICVIDFDTIMPGFIGFDYGDALRSGANHTREDDPCLDNVYFDFDMFKAFTRGFLETLKDQLWEKEIDSLVDGVKVIVYEQSLRFITDYLLMDPYYKIDYEDHNLVRAKNQLCLLQDIEKKESELRKFVQFSE